MNSKFVVADQGYLRFFVEHVGFWKWGVSEANIHGSASTVVGQWEVGW